MLIKKFQSENFEKKEFDCHAPLKTKAVSQKLQNPWRTDDVAKRKLDRVWRILIHQIHYPSTSVS